MKILAIDSSSLVASCALIEDEILTAELTVNHKKTHSQTLLPMISDLTRMTELELSTLDAIAIAAGPGSFTGLRIGAGTAKGLALALKKPIVSVGTLEALAFNLAGSDALVVPILDARRDQVYTGIFSAGELQACPEALLSPCAMSVSDLAKEVNRLAKLQDRPAIFLGDGVPVFRDVLEELLEIPHGYAPAPHNRQRAASVGFLGALLFAAGKAVQGADFVPFYLRPSQAERVRMETQAGKPSAAQQKESEPAERPADIRAKLTIRPLEEPDAEAVSEIEAECFSMPWSRESFLLLAKKPEAHYFVARLGDTIVGVCGLLQILDQGDISNVAVKASYRRKGIGRALMGKLLKTAKKLALKELTLEVRLSNAPAIALYEGMGFAKAGVRPHFYEKPEEDALMMKWINDAPDAHPDKEPA